MGPQPSPGQWDKPLALPVLIPTSILDTHGYRSSEAEGGNPGAAPRGGAAGVRRARDRARDSGRRGGGSGLYEGGDLTGGPGQKGLSVGTVRGVRGPSPP